MVKRRHRFKQTTTLAERLAQEASRLREQARSLAPGPEQAQLWRKIRQAETALRIDEWLTLPHNAPPGEVVPFMEGHHRKRRKPSGEAARHDRGDVRS